MPMRKTKPAPKKSVLAKKAEKLFSFPQSDAIVFIELSPSYPWGTQSCAKLHHLFGV